MAKAKTSPNFQELNDELVSIIAELQREDVDVDRALKLYERGLQLTRQLQKYLRTAENKIHELSAAFDDRPA